MVKQISVFIENKSGRMAEATRAISDAGVNIRALAVADTSELGVLRLICDDMDKALGALKDAGFTATANNVIAAQVPDRPGGLADLLEKLRDNGINVEYLYAYFTKTTDNAVVIIRVDDKEKTAETLEGGGIRLLSPEEVYSV